MSLTKWKAILAALAGVPIYYLVIVANSAMALTVILTLLFFRTALVAGVVVIACGVTNALLVWAALQVDEQRRSQRQLFAWTLNESEKERLRIARQLQDDTAQRIAALILSAAGNKVVSTEAAAVMQDLYETAQTLHPPGIWHLGLRGALDLYMRSLEQRFGVEIDLVVDARLESLDRSRALGVFRILEDVLESVLARVPSRVELQVSQVGSNIRAVMTTGVLTSAERFRLGERSAVLGGEAKIGDRSVQTTMVITIPILAKEGHAGHDSRLAG